MVDIRGRTRRETIRALLAHRQDIASCVTRVPILPRVVAGLFEVQLGSDGRSSVTLGGRGGSIRAQEQFEFRDESGFVTATRIQYRFELKLPTQDELVAYHHHPVGFSHERNPHLHVGVASTSALANKHLPTGAIELENFVRFLIIELGARPLRTDWDDVLRA